MSDIKYIDGLIFKEPHERAPDYVIAKISIKREQLIAWLQAQPGEWVNAELKRSQNDKLYAAVDEWKPEQRREPQSARQPAQQSRQAPPPADDDDIPF